MPVTKLRVRATVSARIAIATTAAVFVDPALAQESPVPEQVLITAKPPDPVGNGAFSTTIIDEQKIQIAPQLDQALRQIPALSLFRRQSSVSTNTSGQGVSLRSIGASGAGRALVTLDGVPQNDPFGGWIVWSSLPPEAIQAAEIVRGAGAGPYGAGALTGVIALTERAGTNGVIDAEAAEIGEGRVAGAGNVQFDNMSIGASAMYLTSGGWIPVPDSQRTAADQPLSLKATNAAVHGGVEISDGTQITGRFGFYDEQRNTGIRSGFSTAQGTTGSITIAHPERDNSLGWRIQGWFRDTDISNITYVRTGPNPTGFQYAVPALGWGANAAVRGSFDWLDWEAGVDLRLAQGESRELSSFTNGAFRNTRFAGGRTLVGGLYLEGASRVDEWLFTAGVRFDEWRNYSGHIIDGVLATGAITSNIQTPDASGGVPSARAGVRRDLNDDLYVRAAAYSGFRPATLNELFRNFRIGNDFTAANAGLSPEKLYGVEAGLGDDKGPFTWAVTGFWNKISDAVTLVTLGVGPGTFPIVGALPAGGRYMQRQNVGDIGAFGIEGEAQWALDDMLSLRGGFNLTDAHVHGGTLAPALTGKRPAQTPRWTVTAGLVASPLSWVSVEGYLRWESLRWSDDLNTLPVNQVTVVDTRVNFHVLPKTDLYVGVDNVFDAEVQTARAGDGTINIEAPRLFRLGLRYTY